jgi:hypothetical protein
MVNDWWGEAPERSKGFREGPEHRRLIVLLGLDARRAVIESDRPRLGTCPA